MKLHRAGYITRTGNGQELIIVACGKLGVRLDGKGRHTFWLKDSGTGCKALCLRNGIIVRAGGQVDRYRLVARIGDGHGLGGGGFRIACRFSAEVQLCRGRGNPIGRRDIFRYPDFQAFADIPHRVLYHNIKILCAQSCERGKGDGILTADAGSARPDGVDGRYLCAAFRDCIVIGARLTAGKLHRGGIFAVAAYLAGGQGRGGFVNGRICYFNQLAGVVRQFGIVIFPAVILFVEYVQLCRIAQCYAVGQGKACHAACAIGRAVQMQNAAVAGNCTAYLDHNGNVFLFPCLCAGVGKDDGVADAVGRRVGNLKIAGFVEQRQLPLAAVIISNGCQPAVACFAAGRGRGEEDRVKI